MNTSIKNTPCNNRKLAETVFYVFILTFIYLNLKTLLVKD
jgi:hypothetical protein